jgi:hypothetical protein
LVHEKEVQHKRVLINIVQDQKPIGDKEDSIMKLKILKETLEYTPEKIDFFVAKATKDLDGLEKLFTILRTKVEHLSIGFTIENPTVIRELLKKVEEVKHYSEKVYNEYFDIVDIYDYLNSPKNVQNLDKLTSEIDWLKIDFNYLEEAIENIIDAAKQFSRFSKET